MESLLNNGILATLSVVSIIVANFFYLKNVNQKVVSGGNKKLAIFVSLFSTMPSLYFAAFLGQNTGSIGTPVFGFTFSVELIIIGIIYYFALFFNAKKEILEEKTSKGTVLNKYFVNNAVLGYAAAHYMSGVIMLIVSLGNTIFKTAILSFLDFLPDNLFGAVAGFALLALYICVLPGYIIVKTPELFKNALNKI
ncbi:hypothetical protein [Ligilactobacillus acidipiscis]|uniref:hypothetical protein n=1 Tax=Ligilactobacillus acidipiscis TaxID=89059 RepID=UPI0023F83D53|nr:hypothetical protein [Ligilactobacillus acidipiscis]WEV56410.1 hypothetical protein OZX66_09280 [Ligilactobacillus acidipiscis]